MKTFAFIALTSGLLSTAYLQSAPLPAPPIQQAIPAQINLNMEGYFKRMLAAGGHSESSYTVLERGDNGRYLKLNFVDKTNGKTYLKEYYYWSLGFDIDSDDALIAEVTYTGGYGALPGLYYYKNGNFSRAKSSEVISNYQELEDFIVEYEKQTSNGTDQCCDIRISIPLEGDDMEVITLRDEDAVKLMNRSNKGIRVAVLEYDVIEEKFTFVKN